MGVNATAVKIRVLVGPTAIDFSETLVSFAAGFDKRDTSGIAKISGTLVLTALDNNLALLNPRLNYDIGGGVIPRALWSRGQFIRFQATNDSGVLIDHRFSKLYILKEPLPPKSPQPQDARITLELGCEWKLRDFAAPNPNPLLACDPEDPTLSNTGIVQSPGTVVQKLAVKAGMTGTWEGSIENYPFYYPVSNDSGSYVAVAGEVACSRFYSLVQKRSPAGNLTAVDYRPNVNATPLLTVTIGEDEAEYTPISGQETPCEEVRCTGSTYDITDTWQDTTVCKITYAPGSNKVTRITCTRDAQSATQILHEVEEQEPRGLLAPDDFPGDDTPIFSRRTTNIKTFEVNVCGNGKLLQDETIIVRPFRVAASEFWAGLSTAQKASYAAFSPSQDSRTVVYYHYTPKEVVDEIESRTSRMLASVLPDVDPTTAGVIFQVPAASEIQTYREVHPGQWEYTQAAAQPLIDVFPDSVPDTASVSEKIRLTTTDPISTVSGSGQNNPPAAERRPNRYARNERQLEGVAIFGTFAGANQQDRRRFISVPWMVSNEQANANAQQIGADLIGRRQGAQMLLGLTDVWLTNEYPYPIVHVREPRYVFNSGVWSVIYDTIVYQVDALSFSHDRTTATVGCELIWLATIPAGATVPVLPYVPTVIRSGVTPILKLSAGASSSFGSLIIRTGVTPLIRLFASGSRGVATITRSGVTPVLKLSASGGSYSLPVARTGATPVLRLSASGGDRNASVSRAGTTPVLRFSPAFLEMATADPYIANVALLLKFNGTNGATTFTDSSPSPKTVTGFNGAALSNAQFVSGSTSLRAIANHYLTVPDNAAWDLTGDWTVEVWVRFDTLDNNSFWLSQYDFGTNQRQWWFGINSGGDLDFAFRNNAGTVVKALSPGAASSFLTTNTWYHLAVSRNTVSSTSTGRMFVNGSLVASSTDFAPQSTSTAALAINALLNSGNGVTSGVPQVTGYFDEIRITTGVGRYTINFTPQSSFPTA